MYNNSDDCDLVEGWYTVKVNNVPVVVDTANNVVADQHGKPTVGSVTLQLTMW